MYISYKLQPHFIFLQISSTNSTSSTSFKNRDARPMFYNHVPTIEEATETGGSYIEIILPIQIISVLI